MFGLNELLKNGACIRKTNVIQYVKTDDPYCIYMFHSIYVLTLSILGKHFSRQHFERLFSCFSQKIGFDVLCKLSSVETVCMKPQILYSEKKKQTKKKHKCKICTKPEGIVLLEIMWTVVWCRKISIISQFYDIRSYAPTWYMDSWSDWLSFPDGSKPE